MDSLATRPSRFPSPDPFRRLLRWFLRGCLVLVPVAVTTYVIYFVLSSIDGLLGLDVPGLGFVLTISLITVVGFLSGNIFGERIVGWVEAILMRVPVVKLIYGTLRDVMTSLASQRRSFDRPVLVDLMNGARLLGFLTRDDLEGFGLHDHVAVYIPQSLNFAGNLLLLPRERVQPLQVDTAHAMAFIVSAGLVATQPNGSASAESALS